MAAHFHKHLAALAVLLLAAASCKYPFEMEIQNEDYPLVVEGDILIGAETVLSLSFARPLNSSKDGALYGYPAPFSYFSGYIEGEDGTRVEGTSLVYGTNELRFDTRNLRPDQRYRLHFEAEASGNAYVDPYSSALPVVSVFEGGKMEKKVFESDWLTVCPAPVIDRLSYDKDDVHQELDIALSMHCLGSSHFRWTFTEDWEYHSDIQSSYTFDPNSGMVMGQPYPYYSCWRRDASASIQMFSTENQTEDRFEDLDFIRIPLEDRRLQVLYRVTVRLTALSENAYAYWRTIQEGTYEQGSIFAPTPSMMSSNVHCISDPDYQVLGYLNAGAVAEARMYYDNRLEKYHVPPKSGYFKIERVTVDNDYQSNMGAYRSGYLPNEGVWGDMPSSTPIQFIWVPAPCIDCRMSGGTPDKPDDWPE